MSEIDLRRIKPNRLNPRSSFDKEKIDEISKSIKKFGLLEPIIIRKKNDYYEVVVGERRYRAAKQAGLDKIPAIIKQFSDKEVIELNLIENIEREDLTDIEKGKCCTKLMEDYSTDYPTIFSMGEKLGFGTTTIHRWISAFREISPEIQKYVATADERGRTPIGKIASREALIIAKTVKEPSKQLELVKEVAEKKITRDDVIKITKKVQQDKNKSIKELVEEVEQEPAELIFRLSHMKPILDGIKIQTSRKSLDPKIREGAIIRANLWQPAFADLIVKKIEKKKLGDFTEEDAKREGGYTLEEFKEVWKNLHGNWDPNETVNTIIFKIKKKKNIEMIV
ncbi:Nucleoid occlusion protein [uncultured archaeon]|nr:Nucleoid occlusion protein [uncultured archaeon]